VKKAEEAQNKSTTDVTHLRREILHLREFAAATNESDVAAMVFLSAFVIFFVSSVFTVFRIASFVMPESEWADWLLDATVLASLATLLIALLAIHHLLRKQKHLVRLDRTLAVRASATEVENTKGPTKRVLRITRYQEAITIMRILANLLACIALPWTVYAQWYDVASGEIDGDHSPATVPPSSVPNPVSINGSVYFAAGAVLVAILSTLLFFFMEFGVRYSLPRALGKTLCEPFLDEIRVLYASYKGPRLGLTAPDVVERETWAYVARDFLSKHRFDTVFAADRFGTVLQHLQSGEALSQECPERTDACKNAAPEAALDGDGRRSEKASSTESVTDGQ